MHRKYTPSNMRETVPGIFGEENEEGSEPTRLSDIMEEMQVGNSKAIPWEYKRTRYGGVSKPAHGPGITGNRWDTILTKKRH